MKIRSGMLLCAIVMSITGVLKGVSDMSPQKKSGNAIRKPAVAGAFYPADPEVLRDLVRGYLDGAPIIDLGGEIKALASPHAGYPYSGPTAGHAYKQIEGKRYDVIVVIAPSHREYFQGVSVFAGEGYQTPLGVVPIDGHMAEAIIGYDDSIQSGRAGHGEEHSLEVQLPFLQEAVPDLKIIPIVMADQSFETCSLLAEAITEAAGEKQMLVVASTDLYHGYSYDECVAADTRTLQVVESFQPRELCEGLAQERYHACGGGPMATAMLVAQGMGGNTARVLARTNSNDVMGEKGGYCVGYAAVAFFAESRDPGSGEQADEKTFHGLSGEDKETLLEIARTAIECGVKGEEVPSFRISSDILREDRGAFVTLHKRGQLRGCIGYIEAIKPLYATVQEMAQSAAFHDPRFPPVTEHELKNIQIEISALTPLRRVKTIEEIEVGTHGIYIRKGHMSGLLLPQVAAERGWDRNTFLEQTCVKAGLPVDAWWEQDTEIYIFAADIFHETE